MNLFFSLLKTLWLKIRVYNISHIFLYGIVFIFYLIFSANHVVQAQVKPLPSSYYDTMHKSFDEQSKKIWEMNKTQKTYTEIAQPLPSPTPSTLQAATSSIYLSDPYLSVYFMILTQVFLGISIGCLIIVISYGVLRLYLLKQSVERNKKDKFFLVVKPPHDTAQSAFSTEQVFSFLHQQARIQTFWKRIFREKKTISLEIFSTKDDGIRYVIQTSKKEAPVLKKTLLSYLPGVLINEIQDYLPESLYSIKTEYFNIAEYKLAGHFALPLQNQKVLKDYDPMAFITGHMTQLAKNEMVAMQLILSPVTTNTHAGIMQSVNTLRRRIWNSHEIADIVNNKSTRTRFFDLFLKTVGILVYISMLSILLPLGIIFYLTGKIDSPFFAFPFGGNEKIVIKSAQQEALYKSIQEKINAPLFETSLRLFVSVHTGEAAIERASGFISSLSSFENPSIQHFTIQFGLFQRIVEILGNVGKKDLYNRFLFFNLKNRLLSFSSVNPILSLSEVTDLYHLPYTDTTRTEGLVKIKSKELPAPLSMKKSTTSLDVVVGKNSYGGEETPIGLTIHQRQTHTYLIGKTGMGKSTMLESMIYQDMVNGKGLAVLDPHGDMVENILERIPKNRRKDIIYFDPSDKAYPIGLNILSPGINFADKDDEREWITSAALSVFSKITPKEYWGPRLEHILRNTILTTLHTPNPVLYTIQQLLTDKNYAKHVALNLPDPVLKQFWEKEFHKMGSLQQSQAISPITHRLGKFITNKMSRNILLQEKSTLNMQQIMDEGKILLVNLSKGDLGEDVSEFFGTVITSLIHISAYQRIHIHEKKRKDFFVYIDEFQNFATPTFGKIMSEGRKFHISLISSHQNIAQIEDTSLLKTIAGNAGTIISLKGSPDDERFILPYISPEVEKGDIVNLAPYHFFMKVTNEDSEDAFSGETVPLEVKGNEKVAQEIIAYTIKHYGIPKDEVEKKLEEIFARKIASTKTNKITVKKKQDIQKNGKRLGNVTRKTVTKYDV